MEFADIIAMLKSADLPEEGQLQSAPVEASSRRYYRVQFDNGQDDVIVCSNLPTPYEDNDHFIKISIYLNQRGIPAPKILARDPAQGRLLISDAGKQDLTTLIQQLDPLKDSDRRWELLKQAIDLMMALHRLEPPPIVRGRAFDKEKLTFEIDFLNDTLSDLCRYLKVPNPISYECLTFFYELCDKLATRSELVFTHRDYHGRNLLLDRPGPGRRMTMIDFQDARMGLPYYDLCSLLYDPYTPITRNERLRGLEYYLQNTTPEFKKLRGYYYAQALQRIAKALGTYMHQTFKKGHAIYLDSIGEALNRLDEIIQFGFFPDSTYIFVSQMKKDVLPRVQDSLGKGAPVDP